MSKINLQEPQRNRNATANLVNSKRTSTVTGVILMDSGKLRWIGKDYN